MRLDLQAYKQACINIRIDPDLQAGVDFLGFRCAGWGKKKSLDSKTLIDPEGTMMWGQKTKKRKIRGWDRGSL